jgi:glutaredoxin 3
MTDITIYTTPICPYCVRAKELLKRKGYSVYNEIDVSKSAELRDEMLKKTGGKRSVPQIFINGTHVGGSDDLYALETAGKLDGLSIYTIRHCERSEAIQNFFNWIAASALGLLAMTKACYCLLK